MASMNVSATTSMTGALQTFFKSIWFNLTKTDFETPLANSSNARTAVIPKNSGQAMEARYIDNFEPTVTSTTNSNPLTYAEDDAPATTTRKITATVVAIPLTEISDVISLNPSLLMTDPVPLMEDVKQQFAKLIRRYNHRLANAGFVNEAQDPNTWKQGTLPSPFKTIYAGFGTDGSFADLTEASLHSMDTFTRARSALRNSRIPTFDGMYKCVISDAIAQQLIDEETKFGDFVKRHQDLGESAFVRNVLPPYRGISFIIQDDEYRCNLPASGGSLANRVDTGRVQIATMWGEDAWTYLDLAGERRLAPKFKIQDITPTGNEITIGFRIKTNSSVLQTTRGLNIAGTTEFFSDISDIA